MSYFTDIKDFHQKFGLTYDGPPRPLPKDIGEFRFKFMIEELIEYRERPTKRQLELSSYIFNRAIEDKNIPLDQQLDALVDLVYVAVGTAYLHGFDFDEAWRRVHVANMQKVRAKSDGSDSARGSSHDVVKPEGWVAPDLKDLVS